jgi:hypothetical protein
MLREIQQNPETDFAEMLPLLGEESGHGVKKAAGLGEENIFSINPSQFSLLEQTQPSIRDGLFQNSPHKNVQTQLVLR